MSVEIISEIWSEIKRNISNTLDREEAAETLVNVLIDHNVDVEDIRSGFKGDTDIKRALAQFSEDNDEIDEEEFDPDGED